MDFNIEDHIEYLRLSAEKGKRAARRLSTRKDRYRLGWQIKHLEEWSYDGAWAHRWYLVRRGLGLGGRGRTYVIDQTNRKERRLISRMIHNRNFEATNIHLHLPYWD